MFLNIFFIYLLKKVNFIMSKVILRTKIENDEYTNFLYDNYDIQTKEEVITEIPLINKEELTSINWNILLIVGHSGSGKSTVLNNLRFGETLPMYKEDKCIISQFPNKAPEEVLDLYFGVGLSSIPILLHKPNELSNGERARFDIAWKIANCKNNVVYIDEFTSVVDRPSAQSIAFSLQRYARQHDMQLILASCHYDLINWLNPDLIYNLNKKDKEGNVELERLVYSDDKEYSAYNKINDTEVLSIEKEVI